MTTSTTSIATVSTVLLFGLDAVPANVTITYDLSKPAGWSQPGASEASARETRVRVAEALRALGAETDAGRLTIECTSDGKPVRRGSHHDLPVALGILVALGRVQPPEATDFFLGELSPGGRVRPIRGALPMSHVSESLGGRPCRIVAPAANAPELGFSDDPVFLVSSLQDLVERTVPELLCPEPAPQASEAGHDHLGGPEAGVFPEAVRELRQNAIAGMGRVLLVGGRGAPDLAYLTARTVSEIPMDDADRSLVASIQSIAGIFPTSHGGPGAEPTAAVRRPLRAPHHTVSEAGLVGGGAPGAQPRPGEVTLAHKGALVLDDVTEFRKASLLAVAQALRAGTVRFQQDGRTITYPARPYAVIARAPACACDRAECTCSPEARAQHEERVATVAETLCLHTIRL